MTAFDTGNRDIGPEEEDELMRRIASGDKLAFRTVMGVYMTDIYRFAYSVVGDSARADDIAQEAYIRLWTKAGMWDSAAGGLKTWLFVMTHRLCIDDIRRQRKHHEPIEETENLIPDSGKDPLHALSDKETSEVVKKALLSLPERQRSALMLVHYSGFDNKEAAAILGVSVDALESLLSRGRQKLRGLLSGAQHSEGLEHERGSRKRPI